MTKIKTLRFTAIGLGFVGASLIALTGFKEQSQSYNRYIVEPTEIISAYIDQKANENLQLKRKYSAWSEENREFLQSLLNNSANQKQFNNELKELDIIIKIDNIWDKVGLSTHSYLEKIMPKIMEEQYYLNSIASGKNSLYLRKKLNENTEISEAIYIGLKDLKNKDNLLTQNLLRTFKGNEQQMYDYVLFHEFSHFISTKMNKNNGEDKVVTELQTMIEQDGKTNNIIYEKEDIDILLKQYSESIGDIMAIQLLYKKYPELKKENQLPYNLARVRTAQANDLEHFTVAGLIATQEELKNEDIAQNLSNMLKFAQDKALINIEYYSKPLLKDKKNYIQFSNDHNKEKILSKIDSMRKSIREEESPINFKDYKL